MRNFFDHSPTGSDWFLRLKREENLMIEAVAKKKRTIYELNVFTVQTNSAYDDFDSFRNYVENRRMTRVSKTEREILETKFKASERFGLYGVEFYLKFRYKFSDATNAAPLVVQNHCYDFIHPTRTNLHLSIQYNEMNETGHTNLAKLKEAEVSLNTFVLK